MDYITHNTNSKYHHNGLMLFSESVFEILMGLVPYTPATQKHWLSMEIVLKMS